MTISDDDGWHLTRPNPVGRHASSGTVTGNAEDAELLRQIAARASLDQPRTRRYYVYVSDEALSGSPRPGDQQRSSISPPSIVRRYPR
jgi:hypothetical protein